jgi:hypothetical protein
MAAAAAPCYQKAAKAGPSACPGLPMSTRHIDMAAAAAGDMPPALPQSASTHHCKVVATRPAGACCFQQVQAHMQDTGAECEALHMARHGSHSLTSGRHNSVHAGVCMWATGRSTCSSRLQLQAGTILHQQPPRQGCTACQAHLHLVCTPHRVHTHMGPVHQRAARLPADGQNQTT